MRRELIVQLVINGQAAWQIRHAVPAELCRRMTDKELDSIGRVAGEALQEIVLSGPALKTFVAAGVAAQKAAEAVIAKAEVPAGKRRK